MAKPSKKTKDKNSNNQSKKILIATVCIIAIVFVSFTAIYIIFPPKIKKTTSAKKTIKIENKKPVSKVKKKIKKEPLYEIYPEQAHEKDIKFKKEKYKGLPKVCIIIDDIGFDKKAAYEFSNLGVPITLSVIPYTPYGKSIVRKNINSNTEFMVHVPMQPKEYPRIDPGKGALLSKMKPDELIAQLEKDLQWVPMAKGANNHMGSHLTENPDKMNQVFTIIKKKNLFFIDSLTSSKSKCEESAKLFKVDFAKRDIFLDNIQKEKFIIKQLEKLKKVSVRRGFAIGIGHPYTSTINALKSEIPKMKKEVSFVKASSIVKNIQ